MDPNGIPRIKHQVQVEKHLYKICCDSFYMHAYIFVADLKLADSLNMTLNNKTELAKNF